jgi:hypothetical protein
LLGNECGNVTALYVSNTRNAASNLYVTTLPAWTSTWPQNCPATAWKKKQWTQASKLHAKNA